MTHRDPDPWDPEWRRDPDQTRNLPDVTHDDAEPIGTLYGPDGATLAVVYPPRLPFGFVPPEETCGL